MLSEALEYPIKGEEVLRTYVIAGFLWMINILVIPVFPVLGYMLKVGEESSYGSEELPRFSNFKKLFLDGLKLSILLVGFILPGSIILVLAGYLGEFSSILGDVSTLAGSLTYLVFLLAFPMSAISFARENSMKAAFHIENFRYIITKPYWAAVLSSIGVSILGLVAVILVVFALALSIVGILLLPLVALAWPIYINIFVFRVFGLAYRELEER